MKKLTFGFALVALIAVALLTSCPTTPPGPGPVVDTSLLIKSFEADDLITADFGLFGWNPTISPILTPGETGATEGSNALAIAISGADSTNNYTDYIGVSGSGTGVNLSGHTSVTMDVTYTDAPIANTSLTFNFKLALAGNASSGWVDNVFEMSDITLSPNATAQTVTFTIPSALASVTDLWNLGLQVLLVGATGDNTENDLTFYIDNIELN